MQPNANNLRGRRSTRPMTGRRDGREVPQARGTAGGPRDHRARCFAPGGKWEQRPVVEPLRSGVDRIWSPLQSRFLEQDIRSDGPSDRRLG
jgi:hypothetical protein